MSLWGYKGDTLSPFIKITCTDQKAIPRVKDEFYPPLRLKSPSNKLTLAPGCWGFGGGYLRAFERGQVDFPGFSDKPDVMTYESNIAYTLRFMVDTKVGCHADPLQRKGGWVHADLANRIPGCPPPRARLLE
jgi:DNA polymerase delta subunit 1